MHVDGDQRQLDRDHGGEQDAAGPAVLGKEIGTGEPPDGGERREQALTRGISCRTGGACEGVALRTPAFGRLQPLATRYVRTNSRPPYPTKIGRIGAFREGPRLVSHGCAVEPRNLSSVIQANGAVRKGALLIRALHGAMAPPSTLRPDRNALFRWFNLKSDEGRRL